MDREEKERFHWWHADISYLPLFASKIKKSEWVTPCAKEIGLGPTLFLMTMKAFFWIFCLLAILNIPLMIFYTGGSGTKQEGGNFVTMFGTLALGNIGTSGMTCSSVNVGQNEKKFDMQCRYGTMRELFEFGIQKIDNQSCNSEEAGNFVGEGPDGWDDLQWECNRENGLSESGKSKLQ